MSTSASERLEHMRRMSEMEEIQRRRIRREEEEERQRRVKEDLRRMEEELAAKRNVRSPVRPQPPNTTPTSFTSAYQPVTSPITSPISSPLSPTSRFDQALEFRPITFDPPSYKPGVRDPARPYLHPAEVEAARRVVGSFHSRSRSTSARYDEANFASQDNIGASPAIASGALRPAEKSVPETSPQTGAQYHHHDDSAVNDKPRSPTPVKTSPPSTRHSRTTSSNTSRSGSTTALPQQSVDPSAPAPPPRRSRARSVGAAVARQQLAEREGTTSGPLISDKASSSVQESSLQLKLAPEMPLTSSQASFPGLGGLSNESSNPVDQRLRTRTHGGRSNPGSQSVSPLPTPPTVYHHPAPTFPTEDSYPPTAPPSDFSSRRERERNKSERDAAKTQDPSRMGLPASESDVPLTPTDDGSTTDGTVSQSGRRSKKTRRSRSGGELTSSEPAVLEQDPSSRTRARSQPVVDPELSTERSSRGSRDKSKSSLDRPHASGDKQYNSLDRSGRNSLGRAQATMERSYGSLERHSKSLQQFSGETQYGSLERTPKISLDRPKIPPEFREQPTNPTTPPRQNDLFYSSILPISSAPFSEIGDTLNNAPTEQFATHPDGNGYPTDNVTNPPNRALPPPGTGHVLPPTKRPVARPGARVPTQAFREGMRENSNAQSAESNDEPPKPSSPVVESPRRSNRRASQPALPSHRGNGTVAPAPTEVFDPKPESPSLSRRASQPALIFEEINGASSSWGSEQQNNDSLGSSSNGGKRKWTVAMPPPLATASRGAKPTAVLLPAFAGSAPSSPASITGSSADSQPPSPSGENAEIARLRAGLRKVGGEQSNQNQKDLNELDVVRLRRAGEDGAVRQIERPRTLWMCRGKKRVCLTKVPLALQSLTDSDCFILDDTPPPTDSPDRPDQMGATSRLREATVWIFFGKDAGTVKRSRAVEIGNRWNALENVGRGKVLIVEESKGSSNDFDMFLELLSSPVQMVDPHPPVSFMPLDDVAWDTQVEAATAILEDRGGNWLETQKGSLLTWKGRSDGIIIVQCVDVVYVWQPTRASATIVNAATEFARHIGNTSSPDPTVPLPLFIERQARESPHFRERFSDFADKGGATLEVKKQGNVVLREKMWGVYDRGADVARPDRIDPLLMLRGHEPMARWDDNDIFKMIDAGSLETRIWLSTTVNVKELSPSEHGIFYSSESYIIYYRYRDGRYPQLEKDASVVFYWQGRTTLQKDQGTAALLVAETYRGTDVRQLRVEQDREPAEFMGAFGGVVIVRKGSRSTFEPGERRLYQVYRSGAGEGVRVSETALTPKSLSPWDSFVMTGKNTIWVWHGQGSSKQQIAIAKRVAREKCGGDPRSISEVHQGAESVEFWDKIGSSKSGAVVLTKSEAEACQARHEMSMKFDEDSVVIEEGKPPKGWRRRLWKVSHVMTSPSTEEIRPFHALDLEEESVYILDAWSSMYVWMGSRAMAKWKDIKEALEAAEAYCKLASADEDCLQRLLFSHAFVVRSGEETKAFTDHFLCWNARVPPSPTTSGFKSAFGKMGSLILKGGHSGHAEALETVESLLTKITRGDYSLEELKAKDKPLGLDPANLENYLIADEFKRLFGMEKSQFLALPQWKKTELKKKVDFF
ncbi:hypothetical protein M427DRAFT_138875 [Gonapodya prolifera JEL478]|uniref:HP domain-containing protein n=1 Tax=Gonapodya prolifera (strain JEL478) TaxID=1344416 RepID=A0A139A1X1_GONPJ|nr:hypothetical protein M427DRAFT_138875 [Gonapodya prolifera JEL478]|eukprot:KXS10777.1 hypothetical protein M427DRAFT_138875 [Gonapodya prolifera JEL478]